MSYFRTMASPRVWPLVLGLLGGCITQSSGGGGGYGGYDGWGSGVGGGGGNSGYGCHLDSECGTGSVCARDGECLLASQVRIVHVNWTLHQQPAATATCAAAADLDITFYDGQTTFGFSPVPCVEGKFTVDKLPTSYTSVGLERAGDGSGGATATFDTTGVATIDLPY